MAIDLSVHLSSHPTVSLDEAILETLAYSDVFDYPLRLDELNRFLPLAVSNEALLLTLNHPDPRIGSQDGYYFLTGRKALVPLRQKRNVASHAAFEHALRYGDILGRLPFIRMVGLTGSLAVLNSEQTADIDYMLIAEHGRVWSARAFALLFGRVTAIFGYTLCPNLILSDKVLEWEHKDLYSARELCQMIPLTGSKTYSLLRQANSWTDTLLPNAAGAPEGPLSLANSFRVQTLAEIPLRTQLFNPIEAWEMKRKRKRFMSQSGFGEETRFNENICQGNFNHHGLQTRRAYQQRLRRLGLHMNRKIDEL